MLSLCKFCLREIDWVYDANKKKFLPVDTHTLKRHLCEEYYLKTGKPIPKSLRK